VLSIDTKFSSSLGGHEEQHKHFSQLKNTEIPITIAGVCNRVSYFT